MGNQASVFLFLLENRVVDSNVVKIREFVCLGTLHSNETK